MRLLEVRQTIASSCLIQRPSVFLGVTKDLLIAVSHLLTFDPLAYLCVATYYLSSSGSDSNDGTTAALAWATFDHVRTNWVSLFPLPGLFFLFHLLFSLPSLSLMIV